MGPSYFAPDAKTSLGNWRAAPLPQWTAGANVAANWGGSTYPVFSQSKHPKEAAEFSEWLTLDLGHDPAQHDQPGRHLPADPWPAPAGQTRSAGYGAAACGVVKRPLGCWWWSGRKTSCPGRRRYDNLQQSGPMLIG